VEIGATVLAGVTIDWYNDATGGTPFATDNATITVSATSSATYYAQARNTTTGCVSATRLPVTVTVDPVVAQATITGYSSNSCPTTTVSLTATATGATGYTWYRNGSQVQKSTSPNYTVSSTGNYTVVGYNASCSGATSTNKSVTINPCVYSSACNLQLLQGSSSTDGNRNWADASADCSTRGFRLPTLSEMACLCQNNPPGGLNPTNDAPYWTTTKHESKGYFAVRDACNETPYVETTIGQYRCVK
jgi:hypothetical protein